MNQTDSSSSAVDVLLNQQGYEIQLYAANSWKYDLVVDLFRYRGRRFGFLIHTATLYISILMMCFNRSWRVNLYFSSRESDEYFVIIILMLKIAFIRVVYIETKVNNREDSFEMLGGDVELDLPIRTKLLLSLMHGFTGIDIFACTNDVGQRGYFIAVSADRILLAPKRSSNEGIDWSRVRRLIILAEPVRSAAVLSLHRWKSAISKICDVALAKRPDIAICVKHHPYVSCDDTFSDFQEIEKLSNLFALLKDDDLVVGTFGNLIDVGPCLSQVVSVFPSCALEPIDAAILARVECSGAILV